MNGHSSYEAWNIHLWINNDEGLYNMARECVRENCSPTDAAAEFINTVSELGMDSTPDGVAFERFHVEDVMEELEEQLAEEI